MAYLTLFVALSISAVAAWYSIVGLAAIFSAAVIPIVIMGTALEAGKLVTASWLYQNWSIAPRFLKVYLTTAVVVLMFITSMGIFGFLSKAHIDQTLAGGDSTIELQVIDNQIRNEQRRIDNAQRSLSALDRLVDQSDTETAIKVRNNQGRERTRLLGEIKSASDTIQTLNVQAAPLRKELKQITAEVGPIKYIADLIYGDSSTDTLEKAVRAVIIIIVFVFDPLAVLLIIAANMTLNQNKNRLTTKKVAVVNDFGEWSEDERTINEEQVETLREQIKTLDMLLETYYNQKIKKNSEEYKEMRKLEKMRADLLRQLKGTVDE